MNNVKDQKAQIAQLQRDRIYEMLKELNDDKLINPNESSNTNTFYHLYNDSNITYQKCGWAYRQRSEFDLIPSIAINLNLDIKKFKYLVTSNTTSFGYIIVSEANARLIRNEMIALLKIMYNF